MNNADKVTIRVLKLAEDLATPAYQTPGSSGADLCAAVEEELMLEPGQFALIPTGIKIELPPGFEAQVRPRSGLAAQHGIGVLNSPGTIDADYRGEIKVVLFNFGKHPFRVGRGERIAQLVIARVVRGSFEEVERLDATERDAGGFGHTGK